MTLPGSGAQGFPRVPQQKDLRTKRALRRFAGNNDTGGGVGGATIIRGTFASRPPPGNAGTLFLNASANEWFFDDGTQWIGIGPQLSGAHVPVATDFTFLNQGGATVDFSGGPMVLAVTGESSGAWKFRGLQQPAPAAPYALFSQMAMNVAIGATFFSLGGLFFYDSNTGKLVTLGVGWRPDVGTLGGAALNITYWSDINTPAADLVLQGAPPFFGPPWLAISRTGGNRLYAYSQDGSNFTNCYTEPDGTNGVNPDTIGVFLSYLNVTTLFRLTNTVYATHG